MQTITVVYEKGVLRPLVPLKLQEKETVQIQILTAANPVQQYVQQLAALGLVTPPPGQTDVEPMPDAERQRLADKAGQFASKPLSEIIIEDRGEW